MSDYFLVIASKSFEALGPQQGTLKNAGATLDFIPYEVFEGFKLDLLSVKLITRCVW